MLGEERVEGERRADGGGGRRMYVGGSYAGSKGYCEFTNTHTYVYINSIGKLVYFECIVI